uniref:Glycosyltransferase n=1 Tax=Petunia hybrida TaxID=4102 RepID=Q9SBQ2_PETHY|nr:anthocyanin 5-O-glucosyltransferase [Petunia x hybrida]
MVQPHVILTTFPAQGHINPALQFAKNLVKMGIEVTFSTSIYAQSRMDEKSILNAPKGLNFIPFSDGFDEGFDHSKDPVFYMSQLRKCGSETVKKIILTCSENGQPITCLLYSIFLPWAAEVAREVHIPSALLWSQPATILDIYYFNFHGYEKAMANESNDPNWSIQLPGLPLLETRDLPSFLLPYGAKGSLRVALPPFKELIDTLDAETTPKILVNTFDELEPEALNAIEGYKFYGIGPLIPSAFLGGNDPLDASFGGDLFQNSNDYMEWLNSKPNSSVVYISFGSLMNPSISQMEEISKGLIDIGRPFLWVIKENEKGKEEENKKLGCIEELEKIGKIVPWCSQLEVLKHPSLGCFVSHCGWNSALESLACGVPVVAFPQWTDQMTNAKQVEDVWKSGVRVRINEDGVVESEEIKRCIELVMDGGEKGEELRKNAKKWKELAREAVKEGGSSHKNLKAFIDDVAKGF